MKKFFAVSDIHSYKKELDEALIAKGFDVNNPNHYLIVCGDALDRGDESAEVMNFLKHLHSLGRLVYVRGNHEDLLKQLISTIRLGGTIGYHHYSNGTFKTICDICGIGKYDLLSGCYDKSEFDNSMNELIKFIDDNSVDYYQLGNTVFVHGWVPTTITSEDDHTETVDVDWRNGDWSKARWENGQEMFKFGVVPADIDTVVCGHWHTSWGWKNIKKQCTEWGDDACFDALIHEQNGKRIVALDGCTAYTRQVNVVIFDENGGIIEE